MEPPGASSIAEPLRTPDWKATPGSPQGAHRPPIPLTVRPVFMADQGGGSHHLQHHHPARRNTAQGANPTAAGSEPAAHPPEAT